LQPGRLYCEASKVFALSKVLVADESFEYDAGHLAQPKNVTTDNSKVGHSLGNHLVVISLVQLKIPFYKEHQSLHEFTTRVAGTGYCLIGS
jgi:hypothetical protein